MMPTLYLARVSADDFQRLKSVVPEVLADSYEAWAERQAEEMERWEAIGGTAVLVDLSATEVLRHHRRTGASITAHDLQTLATSRALAIQSESVVSARLAQWQLGRAAE
jgi:hypothetical protein